MARARSVSIVAGCVRGRFPTIEVHMMIRLAIAVVVGGAAAGCSNGVAWNHPLHKVSAEEITRRSAMRGYQEVRRDNTILVASTYDGVKRVKRGGEPAIKVAAIGFGPKGEKVIFEASKDGMLEKALMSEFGRRHGDRQG